MIKQICPLPKNPSYSQSPCLISVNIFWLPSIGSLANSSFGRPSRKVARPWPFQWGLSSSGLNVTIVPSNWTFRITSGVLMLPPTRISLWGFASVILVQRKVIYHAFEVIINPSLNYFALWYCILYCCSLFKKIIKIMIIVFDCLPFIKHI